MRYCLIKAGSSWPRPVVDLREAPAGWTDPGGLQAVASDTAQIGWSYDGSLFTGPIVLPTVAQLLAYANAKQDAVLGQVWSFNVGPSTAPAILTTKLDDRGHRWVTALNVWASKLTTLPTDTQPFISADLRKTTTIVPAQALSLDTQAEAVIAKTFLVLTQLVAAITAASPTITTKAQIDAAAWPTP